MRDSNLIGIGFLFLVKCVFGLEISIIHPRVFLKRDSLYPLVSNVLLCKLLFDREIFSNLDKNIPVGYQESPPKSLFGYLCPSVDDDLLQVEGTHGV